MTYQVYPLRRHVLSICFAAFILALVACSNSTQVPTPNGRPSCVTLPVYSSVIEQVVGVYPEWSPPRATQFGYEASWVIEAKDGTHQLTATLTRNECICATSAQSRFPSGSPQAKFAGYLQGAAVAPVSDLELLSGWLEPKILFRCPLAFLVRNEYIHSETMADGTFWKLECQRPGDPLYADLEYTFSVATQKCQALVP